MGDKTDREMIEKILSTLLALKELIIADREWMLSDSFVDTLAERIVANEKAKAARAEIEAGRHCGPAVVMPPPGTMETISPVDMNEWFGPVKDTGWVAANRDFIREVTPEPLKATSQVDAFGSPTGVMITSSFRDAYLPPWVTRRQFFNACLAELCIQDIPADSPGWVGRNLRFIEAALRDDETIASRTDTEIIIERGGRRRMVALKHSATLGFYLNAIDHLRAEPFDGDAGPGWVGRSWGTIKAECTSRGYDAVRMHDGIDIHCGRKVVRLANEMDYAEYTAAMDYLADKDDGVDEPMLSGEKWDAHVADCQKEIDSWSDWKRDVAYKAFGVKPPEHPHLPTVKVSMRPVTDEEIEEIGKEWAEATKPDDVGEPERKVKFREFL